MPIALFLPLLPMLIELAGKIVTAVRDSGELSPAQRLKLDELSDRLDETNTAVQALEIRDV